MSKASKERPVLVSQVLLFCLALGVLAGAAAIPFVWESQSLYYKVGPDKALLHWGKAAGFAALALMVFQLILMSRFRVLDRIIGLGRLFFLHRCLGLAVVALILIHPLLVLWSDRFVLFPPALRYWPEFLGVFALVWGLVLVGTALFRSGTGLSPSAWQSLHRALVPVFLGPAFVHAFFVSETFNHALPRYGLILAGIAAALLWLRRVTAPRPQPRKP